MSNMRGYSEAAESGTETLNPNPNQPKMTPTTNNPPENPPAFPTHRLEYEQGIGHYHETHHGMTLRDYFAAKASDEDVIQVINDNGHGALTRQQARFIHADMMLAARQKGAQ